MTPEQKMVEETLTRMINHQREKVMRIANVIDPHVTPEDLRNPQDLPKIASDPQFNYEDGILSGLISAQIALRSAFNHSK